MIGIIANELTAFSIIEAIKKEYPKVNIYWKNNIANDENQVQILLQKKCNIIIVPSDKYIPKDNPKDISFIVISKIKEKENYFEIKNNKITNAVKIGDVKSIQKELQKISIPKDKIILLNTSELLYIKELIKEYFPNSIIDFREQLLDNLKGVIEKKKINIEGEGICNRIEG